jgi:hypothetical protein
METAHGWEYVRSKKNGRNTTPTSKDCMARSPGHNYDAKQKANENSRSNALESDCAEYFEQEAEEQGVHHVRTIIRDEIHVEDDGVTTWYLILWEGMEGECEKTWEPEENVGQEAIAEYRAKCRGKG